MQETADSTEPYPVIMTTMGQSVLAMISSNRSVPSPSGKRKSRKTRSKELLPKFFGRLLNHQMEATEYLLFRNWVSNFLRIIISCPPLFSRCHKKILKLPRFVAREAVHRKKCHLLRFLQSEKLTCMGLELPSCQRNSSEPKI